MILAEASLGVATGSGNLQVLVICVRCGLPHGAWALRSESQSQGIWAFCLSQKATEPAAQPFRLQAQRDLYELGLVEGHAWHSKPKPFITISPLQLSHGSGLRSCILRTVAGCVQSKAERGSG